MPTISTSKFPRTTDPDEFESMCRAAMALRWNSPNLQKNGRKGQRQQGIDIYGPDEIGRQVGIQCKNYTDSPSMTLIRKEIANAEGFSGQLSALFIAASGDFDSKLQQQVRLLSEQRVAAGKFAVSMLFWNEIIDGLQLNPQVIKNFFPHINLPTAVEVDRGRLLAAFELGYYGPYIWSYVELIYGEMGWIAQEDTDQVEIILRIVDQRVSQVLDEHDAEVIRESIGKIRKACSKKKKSPRTWDEVKDYAMRVANRVKTASSLIGVNEGGVLDLGRALGAVYLHSDHAPDQATKNRIRRQALAIVPDAGGSIDEAMKQVAKARAGYSWAPKIYTQITQEIRCLT